MRRRLALPIADGRTIVDTDPADKSGTMNEIRNRGGLRAVGLAKKGRIDQEKSGVINISDEVMILSAFWHALTTGIDTVVLSADADSVEIFQKAQWFLDTHYRAWLAARLVHEGRYGEPCGTLEQTYGLFAGPITLYKRPTNNLHEVLPRLYTPVELSLVYTAPDNQVYNWSVRLDREMGGMLETKTRTEGRCTDHFGEDNIHVHLGPLTKIMPSLCLGIGRDNGDWCETGQTRQFLSELDAVHGLNCFERHEQLSQFGNPPAPERE
jgi:hypothetical protein